MRIKVTTMVILAVTFLAFAFVSSANSENSAEISATVENTAPEILYKFELPDDNPTEPGTQVIPSIDLNINPDCHDCDVDIQQTVYVYSVVYDANGADDVANVHVQTFYPPGIPKDGALLCESDAVEVDPADVPAALDDAVSTHLLAADDREIILDWIAEGIANLYVAEVVLHHCKPDCKPAGLYTVEVTATDHDGVSDTMENTFECLEWIMVKIDFCVVDYETVMPCQEKWVYGDDTFCTKDIPTIQVISTAHAAYVIISATPMDRVGGGGSIPADSLDAGIGSEAHYLNETGVRFYDIDVCTLTPLNFSLHAPSGTPAGNYTGTITITGVPL